MNVPEPIPGIQFASDNYAGACPEAIAALLSANEGFSPAYGEDKWTRQAADAIRTFLGVSADVFFVFNGTAANSLALAALCQSYHSLICHELAHVETDECGAPEFFSNGTKLLIARGRHGKLDPDELRRLARLRVDIHYPKPKVVTISQPTELGTVYSLGELATLRLVARKLGLRLHVDGARLFNSLATSGIQPHDFVSASGVDVLSLGGTKIGLTGGEAVVFFNRDLAEDFAYRCKQSGQLASKMRYLSSQWSALLSGETWRTHAANANRMASLLRSLIEEAPGIRFAAPTEANSVFLLSTPKLFAFLRSKGWVFYEFIGGAARFMCSWRTTEEEVRLLARDIQQGYQLHASTE